MVGEHQKRTIILKLTYLSDNIVPTSGMRGELQGHLLSIFRASNNWPACTAVVTEIGYHPKKTIDGDVSFLSEKEWRDELAVLLEDLVDEDGNLKRSTDLRSDAGVAWSKVCIMLRLSLKLVHFIGSRSMQCTRLSRKNS